MAIVYFCIIYRAISVAWATFFFYWTLYKKKMSFVFFTPLTEPIDYKGLWLEVEYYYVIKNDAKNITYSGEVKESNNILCIIARKEQYSKKKSCLV